MGETGCGEASGSVKLGPAWSGKTVTVRRFAVKRRVGAAPLESSTANHRMLCPPLTPAPIVQDWLARHSRPVSFALHIVGIPLTLIGGLLVPIYICLLSLPIFAFSISLFVGGYLLQFLGHGLEGTEPGEVAYLRKKITRSIRKRWRKTIVATVPPRQTPGPIG